MDEVMLERKGGIVTVTLNRPEKKNAATQPMWVELRRIFQQVASSTDDRVLVLTGAGGSFCSGVDLTATDSDAHQLVKMRVVSETILALHRLPKPTLAKVPGIAAGAGCNIALACDLIIASEDARFSQLFAQRGLSIDSGGSWLLPRMIGLHRAKELAFFADIISAKEAAEFGFVNRVVPAAELDSTVDEWAQRLASGPPLALSMTKLMLNNSMAVSMDQALEDEARSQAVNASTADTREAMRAFAEKRQPHFEGK